MRLKKLPVRKCSTYTNTHNFLKNIGRKVRITSSPHGPYDLGYRRVTMAITKSSESASWSKSLKIVLVRIVGCNSPT